LQTRDLPDLTASERRRAMRLSRFDAAVYAVMVGLGEAYFLADGVRLGASAAEIALLVGLPLALGACGPILALRLLRTLGRRKPVVVGGAAGQAAVLFLLAGLDAGGVTTARVLIAASVAYQVCAQAAGTAWSSWYGDLVPAAVRGRYFATRNRGAYAGTLFGLIAGGLLLSVLEPARAGVAGAAGGAGFAVAYAAAGACRCASVALLVASREGRFSGVPDRARVARFLRTQRGSGAWRLVLLVGALQVAVYVASPFFNPYMLAHLGFTYLEYMAASACLVVVKVLVLPLWGRAIDRGGARKTLLRGAALLALVPLPWIFVGELGGALFCLALSGSAWAGFEVGHFALLLELGYRRMRPTVFAAQSVVTGCAQLGGALIGGGLLGLLDPRAVFGLSGGLRITVALLLIRLAPAGARAIGRVRPAFRVAGFRAGTGMAQRPVEESDVASEPVSSSEPR
jgi:MFS family permease